MIAAESDAYLPYIGIGIGAMVAVYSWK
jgi:hypothetical protein